MKHYLILLWNPGVKDVPVEWRVCWSDDQQTVETVTPDIEVELELHNIPAVLMGVYEIPSLPDRFAELPRGLNWGRFGGVFKCADTGSI